MRLLLLNGPNLNLLGQREPGLYGRQTLEQIEQALKQRATAAGVQLDCFQSNFEGALVERVQGDALPCPNSLKYPKNMPFQPFY